MEPQTLINIGFACAGVFGGWPVDPLAEVDPAFVSLTEV